jgi:hypothetical protein
MQRFHNLITNIKSKPIKELLNCLIMRTITIIYNENNNIEFRPKLHT